MRKDSGRSFDEFCQKNKVTEEEERELIVYLMFLKLKYILPIIYRRLL